MGKGPSAVIGGVRLKRERIGATSEFFRYDPKSSNLKLHNHKLVVCPGDSTLVESANFKRDLGSATREPVNHFYLYDLYSDSQ